MQYELCRLRNNLVVSHVQASLAFLIRAPNIDFLLISDDAAVVVAASNIIHKYFRQLFNHSRHWVEDHSIVCL